MGPKHFLLSALSVVGVSIGLRYASGQTVGLRRGVSGSGEQWLLFLFFLNESFQMILSI